ncbi:MAG TPA: fibronectin type III domain-containing protein [Candidatus Paceibacterota bacterium]|nr:fibronectin type III domain-containing protein [Candidatus Paceibacterota bacterium]
MNKLKIILIISGIILGMGTLTSVASAAGLSVEFENSPLFNKANFAPGNTTTQWVKIGNTSGSTQKVIVEAINKTDSNNFAEQLNLIIKEGETEIFNKTLKEFFNQGETYLSDLANNGNTRYDFSITFNANANDNWQAKTLGFDIVIGFQGQEGQGGGGGTSGGSGGGGSPGIPALSIYNEASVIPSETSVTITWTTSYAATSQVIYGTGDEAHTLNLSDNTGIPPLYGYAHTTPEYDIATKVVYHSVTITGLTSGTIYYYRAVSHGSLAIGQEFTFITTGVKPIIEAMGEVAGAFTEIPAQIAETDAITETENITEEETNIEEKPVAEEQTLEVVSIEKPSLLASIFNFSTFGKSIKTIVIIAVIALLIYWIILFFTKKNKKKDSLQNPNIKNGQWK